MNSPSRLAFDSSRTHRNTRRYSWESEDTSNVQGDATKYDISDTLIKTSSEFAFKDSIEILMKRYWKDTNSVVSDIKESNINVFDVVLYTALLISFVFSLAISYIPFHYTLINVFCFLFFANYNKNSFLNILYSVKKKINDIKGTVPEDYEFKEKFLTKCFYPTMDNSFDKVISKVEEVQGEINTRRKKHSKQLKKLKRFKDIYNPDDSNLSYDAATKSLEHVIEECITKDTVLHTSIRDFREMQNNFKVGSIDMLESIQELKTVSEAEKLAKELKEDINITVNILQEVDIMQSILPQFKKIISLNIPKLVSDIETEILKKEVLAQITL